MTQRLIRQSKTVTNWSELEGKPATFPSAWDLVADKPLIFASTWDSVANKPAAFPSNWASIADRPAAFASTWELVTGKPTTFASNWASVADKPATFPSTWGSVADKPAAFASTWELVTGKPTTFASNWASIADKPLTFASTWDSVANKPTTFASTWASVANKPARLPDWETEPWQSLPLAAGWVENDASGGYTPKFVKRAGLVFIAGLIRATVANNASTVVLATLPAGNRPSQLGSPIVWSSNGGPPVLLYPSGELVIYGPVSAGFVQWLDIRFAV